MDREKLVSRLLSPGHTACKRKFVRCLIVGYEGEVLAEGTNGPALGQSCKNIKGGCGCGHAEPMALAECNGRPYAALITHSPCQSCAELLVQRGVRVVLYYKFEPHHSEALNWLASRGVLVQNTDAALAQRESARRVD